MHQKLKQWIKRYLPAEIICTITALVASFLAYYFTKNIIFTAYAGTWGENLGYYGFMVTRDAKASHKYHKLNNKKYGIYSFIKTIRNLIFEFGFSEIIDSFLIRPFFMYFFPIVLGNLAIGIICGKIAADICFYIPTIFFYEARKKSF